MPALFTRMSHGPMARDALSAAATLAGSAISQVTASAPTPVGRNTSAVASHFALSLSSSTNDAPADAIATATARPIPLPAPVTTHIRSFSPSQSALFWSMVHPLGFLLADSFPAGKATRQCLVRLA